MSLPNLRFLAALACLIIGFTLGVVEGTFLFPSLVWFVAAIAVAVLPDYG